MAVARTLGFALFCALAAASCARAQVDRARPRTAETRAAPAEAQPVCRIATDDWSSSIAIDPGDGLPGFDVSTERAVMSPARGGGWKARSDAVLAFGGAIAEPELITARAIDDGDVVHFEPGLSIDSVRLARGGGGLSARVWLASRHDSPSALEIAVEGVPLRCDDLRAAPADDEGGRARRPSDIWSPVRMADFGFLQVRSSPTGPPRVTVRGEGLFVHVLEDDGDAALVVAQWSDGSRVRGWVERSALREPEREEALRIGRAMGGLAELDVGSAIPLSAWASRATVGLGGGRLWMRRPHRAEPAAPLVSAAIAIGSRVYAAPGRGAWATVARDTLFEVSARPLCEWVAIARAPGLTIPSLRAWVRAGTLRIGR